MKLAKLASLAPALALISVSFGIGQSSAQAAQSSPVIIQEGGKTYKGDLYFPDSAKGPLPLVVVVHEWWGKTDYSATRSKQIADELGYAALAVDLYGDAKTTESAKDAGDLAGPFYKNPADGVKLLEAFIAAAPKAGEEAKVSLDTSKLAAIGYCFGGTQVLNLARSNSLPANDKLLGVVSFHGGLGSSLQAKAPFGPKVLALHGAADKMVGPDQVAAFKDEMKKAHADLKFVAYPGALHAFSNPKATEMGKKNNIPVAYNKAADQGSWKEMKAFLKTLFR